MKAKLFLIIALLTVGLSAKGQNNQIIEAVSPSKQAELPLQNCPKLVIGVTELTFMDNINETKFSTDERVVIRLKKKSDVLTDIEKANIQKKEKRESAFYNLAGQRVSSDVQGLLIKDGKKFIRK